MDLSIVMSTRDRGERVLPTVESILHADGCDWELIVVDQSASDATGRALADSGWIPDTRVRYCRSDRAGLSRGRNEGLRQARGAVVAFTDDDCVVSPDWMIGLVRHFQARSDLAVLYAPVLAAYEIGEGWIPEFRPRRRAWCSSPRTW